MQSMSARAKTRWVAFLLAAIAISAYSAMGGVVSKALKKGGQEIAEQKAKEARKELLKQASERSLRTAEAKLTGKLGAGAEDAIRSSAQRVGQNGDDFIFYAAKHPDEFSKLLRAGDNGALDMVARNRDAGRFLISRFYGTPNFRVGSAWFRSEADEAVQEAWKLVSPGRVDGSWKKLRASMTKAGLNGPERDFCEDLFANRVRAGRVPGLKADEIVDGHIGGRRTGFDFIGIDRRTGRVEIIEFGTGRKPDIGNPSQMTDGWIQKRWVELVTDPSTRTMLREKGVKSELLNPERVGTATFDVSMHFGKIICSPDISLAAVKDLGARAVILP